MFLVFFFLQTYRSVKFRLENACNLKKSNLKHSSCFSVRLCHVLGMLNDTDQHLKSFYIYSPRKHVGLFSRSSGSETRATATRDSSRYHSEAAEQGTAVGLLPPCGNQRDLNRNNTTLNSTSHLSSVQNEKHTIQFRALRSQIVILHWTSNLSNRI